MGFLADRSKNIVSVNLRCYLRSLMIVETGKLGYTIIIMKPINISEIVKKYGPGYIAKSRKTGQVVAHAKRLDVLFKKTHKKTDVTISWVPKSNAKYVFRISF